MRDLSRLEISDLLALLRTATIVTASPVGDSLIREVTQFALATTAESPAIDHLTDAVHHLDILFA